MTPPGRGLLGADETVLALSRALADTPGAKYVCGLAVARSLAGLEPGNLLVACRDVASCVARAVEATGLAAVPGRAGTGAFTLRGRGPRSVTFVPLGERIDPVLARASFTATAMAVDLERGGHLIDPHGGQADIDSRVLRSVQGGVKPLVEHPRRLLLAANLRRDLGLEPDADTERALRDASPAVRRVPPGDAWRSLSSAMRAGGLSSTAGFLRRTGVLGELLPEVRAVYDVPQNYYHHLDVWGHTMETLDRLDEMLRRPFEHFKAYGDRMVSHLTRRVEGDVLRVQLLVLAALVHDVGKAGAVKVLESGRIRFEGHEELGAKLAARVACRLGFGRRATRRLCSIVGDHMRLGFLLKDGENVASRLDAAVEMGDRCVEVVMLSVADRMATRGEATTTEALERFKRLATRMLSDWFWLNDFPPLVDGNDVVVHAGVPPGPRVAELLLAARVAQRESIVGSRREALEYLAPDFKGKMDVRDRNL